MIGAWIGLDATATTADASTITPTAPDGPVTLPPEPGGIDQLAFLVGGTWVGTSGGETLAQETCVWGTGQRSIRTTVVLGSGSAITGQGHGRFNCSPTDQLMSHSNIESGGTDQRMYSRQIPIAEKVQEALKQWHFEAVYLTDAGVQHRQMVLLQLGPNEMRINQSMLVSGKRVQVASVSYARTS